MPNSEPPQVAWDLVEQDYRMGQLPIEFILDKYNISRSQLDRRIREGAWTRDLVSQVRASAQEQLAQHDAKLSQKNDMVEAAGETAANVVLVHRKDLRQLRSLATRTMEALARKLDGVPQDGDHSVLTEKQSVIDGIHKLSDAYSRLVAMERQAFNLDDPNAQVSPDAIRTQVEAARRELLRRGIPLADIERAAAGVSRDRASARPDQGSPPPN